MQNKPLNILINAYACGPNWGSEIGMGWNWIINLSNYCQLHIITESNFKEDIEKALPILNLKYIPQFYYEDIGAKGRELFWKQGSFSFYSHYKKWQKRAFLQAKSIIKQNDIDIVHQLNMIGFREPGYLWLIKDKPFIIGPLGGFAMYPWKYMALLGLRDKVFYALRNIINSFQILFLKRYKKALSAASKVYLATPDGQEIISKYSSEFSIASETGAYSYFGDSLSKSFQLNDDLILSWVGVIKGSKALPLALKAIANSKFKSKIKLNVVGVGINELKCKQLAQDLGIADNIVWHGRVNNDESKKIISLSHFLFFTSILEATSTVVFEALQNNTPVICHDAFGFGHVVDNSCGIKIKLSHPRKAVQDFTNVLDNIFHKNFNYAVFSNGCKNKIKEYEWDTKARKMYLDYKNILNG